MTTTHTENPFPNVLAQTLLEATSEVEGWQGTRRNCLMH
jgi:hypothetical protein